MQTAGDMPAGAGQIDATTDFTARTPWTASGATLFGIASLMIAIAGVWIAAASLTINWAGGPIDADANHLVTMVTMGVAQIALIGLVLWAAGWFGGKRLHVLSLDHLPGTSQILTAIAVMALLVGAYNAATYLIWPEHFANDLKFFVEIVRSPAAWLAVVVVVVGAPLSEELLFRGFMLPALAKAPWGIIGAAIVTTAIWGFLHWGYSTLGMIEVMGIGLYFCWVMWRYRSLWLTMFLHALYNGIQVAVLMQAPSHWFA